MAVAAAGIRQHGRIRARAQGARPEAARAGRLSLLAWSALGVALLGVSHLLSDPARLSTFLGDPDDATRMIEVREWMAGASWFDLTLPRLGGAHPLISHWSRIIDAPLFALLQILELFMPPAQAELVVRFVWPLILLCAFAYLIARETELYSGRTAALVSIALTVTCMLGVVQFWPGRIDHHNAMILCAVTGILRLARSFDDADAGWSAGAFLGLGLAIGYESLALTAACLGAAAIFAMLPGRSLLALSRALVTLSAVLAVGVAATVPPDRLFVSHCDALSINLVVLCAIGALGVCIASALEPRLSLASRLALLVATAVAGLVTYGAFEPACLAGPFAQVEPDLFPIWLSLVSETQSVLSLGSRAPAVAAVGVLYIGLGIYCGLRLLRAEPRDSLRFHIVALAIALPLSAWQIKLIPYSMFLPIPLMAIWLAGLPRRLATAPAGRGLWMAAAVVLLSLGFVSLLSQLTEPTTRETVAQIEATQNCLRTKALEPLASLSPGLAVADVTLGPFLVSLTRLDALSAPYHRLGRSIIAAHRILHSSPAEAERLLRETGATYVITCQGLDTTRSQGADPADALQTLLLADRPPPFLAPVVLSAPTPLKVWRVKS